MTAADSSTDLLKAMIDMSDPFVLPKHILLRNEESGHVSYLSPSILAPPSSFSYTEDHDSFLVKSSVDMSDNNSSSESDSDCFNLLSDESDDEGVVYSHLAPALQFYDQMSDLPTPPYTSMFETSDGDGNEASVDGERRPDSTNQDVEQHDNLRNNTNLDQRANWRDLLPKDFDYGTDGIGASSDRHMKQCSFFRKPWLMTDNHIQILIRISKKQFLELVPSCVGSRSRSGELNEFAECFLILYKLCHNPSFEHIAVLFGLKTHKVAARIFYQQTVHHHLYTIILVTRRKLNSC